ncbi:MAG TPA: plastocyanin/azurin family copper-binding protein [Gemmatimonadales bacterium]|nr:plastocyanin/azurin family copper-binding protein [Gemmatimonadales bacterium]
MMHVLKGLGALTLVTLLAAGSAEAQRTHVIQMDGSAEQEEYSFAPATINAKAGDVLVFRVAGGGNHSVSFESSIPAAARQALNAAMPNRVGDLRSPLLSRGSEYRVTLPAGIPAGRYRFFCLPHRAYDEVGYLVVQ